METIKIKFPEVALDLAKQKTYSGIQIVPIVVESEEQEVIDCRFLWKGIADHNVEIKEHSGGYRVPAVTLVNHSDGVFFAHKGCIIRGGGQNRQLQHSFVVAGPGNSDIPVQCIQKGRWNPEQQQQFSSKGDVTASSLRFYKKSQGEVWETITNATASSGTVSLSQDYTILRDYLVGDEEARQQAASQIQASDSEKQNGQYDRRQRAQMILADWQNPGTSQVGLLVTMFDGTARKYGEIIPRYFIEIFSSPQLYAKVHREIISSFAVDAAMYDGQLAVATIDHEKFTQLVGSIEQAPWVEMISIGQEKRYQLDESSDAFGEVVFWQERMLHFMYSHCSLQPPQRLSKLKASASVSDQQRQESPPRQVGNYRLIKSLGQGAMGRIYLGQHIEKSFQVAVKLLAAELQQNDQAMLRFIQEAKVHSRLVHPNIVRILEGGYCSHSNRMYLIMEYIDGDNLENILVARRQPILPKHAVKIALAVARALEHALSMRIIHRDLKPGNILIDRRTRLVKLADLGLGKILEEKGVTLTGAMMGTPFYMPPEQIRDAKNVDHRADIYALGATLYHMLAGRPPYSEQRGTLAIVRAKIYRDPIPLIEYRPELNVELAALVEKAMAREPDARFASPAEIISALENLLNF